MRTRNGQEIDDEFGGKLQGALLSYQIRSGFAFLPAVIGIGLSALVGFETTVGELFAWGGVVISMIILAVLSYQFLRARWHAFDDVNQGQNNG
jgi:cbb3-type cytochrome oxidase subunit 3